MVGVSQVGDYSVLDFSTPDSSSVKQPSTPKKDLKEAQKEDKKIVIEKRDVYITVATSDVPEAPRLDYSMRAADFYRSGETTTTGSIKELPRALAPFEQEETASIRVFGKPAGKKEFTDLIPAYSKFILDTVQESHTERSQIIETFGDFYVFMFGQRPPVYNFSGTLINARNASWVTDFMYMYELYLRGTRCVENNAVAIITYGGRQIEGLILNTANQTSATTESGVPFQFSVVVFERRYYNFSPDMGYSLNELDVLGKDENFIKMLNKTAGIEGKGTSDAKNSDAYNNTSAVLKNAKNDTGVPSTGRVLPTGRVLDSGSMMA